MPKERKKVLCMDAQRHAEYYGMQRTFDELYAKSKAGETFTGLMELVLSPDNIMLAYRNIKTNTGSYTAGTDKLNIGDIGRLPPDEVIDAMKSIGICMPACLKETGTGGLAATPTGEKIREQMA